MITLSLSKKTDTTFSDIPILMIGDICLVHSPHSKCTCYFCWNRQAEPIQFTLLRSWLFAVRSSWSKVGHIGPIGQKWAKLVNKNLKLLVTSWWKVGEKLVKRWWSSWKLGETWMILVKSWWKVGEFGRGLVKLWWKVCQVGKNWWKVGQVGEKLVKLVNLVAGWSSWWKVGRKLVKLVKSRSSWSHCVLVCQQRVMKLWNGRIVQEPMTPQVRPIQVSSAGENTILSLITTGWSNNSIEHHMCELKIRYL